MINVFPATRNGVLGWAMWCFDRGITRFTALRQKFKNVSRSENVAGWKNAEDVAKQHDAIRFGGGRSNRVKPGPTEIFFRGIQGGREEFSCTGVLTSLAGQGACGVGLVARGWPRCASPILPRRRGGAESCKRSLFPQCFGVSADLPLLSGGNLDA